MTAPIQTFDFTAIDGKPMSLADFEGKVLLIVNTASACGFTPQFAGLEKLWQQYRDRGLMIIGFPCNQFGGQDPGSDAEIGAFCQRNYGVSFPMASKVEVNGEGASPLFKYLTEAAPGLMGTRAIKWNFTKFLVSRDGTKIERFAPTTTPEELAASIEQLLS